MAMKITEWKAISDYENLYEISDDGNIRSLDRFEDTGRKGWNLRFRPGRILKCVLHRGYFAITLSKGDVTKTFKIHRLVASAFIGPANGRQIRHLDGNKLNNNFHNLAWGSAKENADDRERHGRSMKGEKNHKAVLTEEQVKFMRLLAECGYGPTAAGYLLGGVSASTAHRIISRKTWRHLS